MAKKKRQRISYVLPLANSPGGHRLGVNGLAVDEDHSILYSGGRDGVICAWDLSPRSEPPPVAKSFSPSEARHPDASAKSPNSTVFRSQVQAHTHWVNDIVLAQNNSVLVSASSDVTVKVWRPHSQDGSNARTIGAHSDYVKCLASPHASADWVASGGLDHKICLWDLSGAGQSLEIDVGKIDGVTKGSIYALCAKGSILASGGPENVLRLWDPKSGSNITKLVGHTDNVRGILMSDDGATLMTASSDQTVKIWSVAAGRCVQTLTMHNDSVWSLFSDHPQLSVFYSGDRSGLVAKTDTRDATDLDEGLSIAVCQEHDGVAKVVTSRGYVWTATSSSSLNKWEDVDTELEVEAPPSPQHSRTGSNLSKSSVSPTTPSRDPKSTTNGTTATNIKIPFNTVLRLSVTAPLPITRSRDRENTLTQSGYNLRKASEAILDGELGIILPLRDLPEETIQGQNGLIKHSMLNDRKRVLTSDTAGEIVLWDILKCIPIRSFGKRHLEDVLPEINTTESVSNWCAVDTRTGKLSVMLEENYCFDAEVYADEIDISERIEFREDQRINLGKWVLRNLFNALIDEELRRDEIYRGNLRAAVGPNGLQRRNVPLSIAIPTTNTQPASSTAESGSSLTSRQPNGMVPMTPGLTIGIATPGGPSAPHTSQTPNLLPPTAEEEATLDRESSHESLPPGSTDRGNDYFSPNSDSHQSEASSESNKGAATPAEEPSGAVATQPSDDKEEKKRSSLFGKKFQMTFPKNIKIGRTSTDVKRAPVAEEKQEDTSDKSSEQEEKPFEENLFGVVQKIRHDYGEQMRANPDQQLSIGIAPSLPNETPALRPPRDTMVIIQEDNPESGGVADLYRGPIGVLGKEADMVERIAPMWLGDLLLKNQVPYKETVKVSFILQPYQDLLPSIASPDGNARLNANRMLRAKKILAYVAERIEAGPEHPDPNALRPEEYLELYCHDQIVHANTTLSTLRVHVWRTGGDVVLYYKANGKKQIKFANTAMPPPAAAATVESTPRPTATTTTTS